MMANDDIRVRARRRQGAEVDARAIRVGLGMSQTVFAKAFGIPLATLRDWERRNRPEGAARVLLMTIDCRPDAVREAVAAYG